MDFRTHRRVLEIVEALNREGSWTGRTHVQKALALLSSITRDVGTEFVLYKHGPYSFELADEIDQMIGYAALRQEIIASYGVKLSPGPNAEFLKRREQLSESLQSGIDAVAKFCGNRPVKDLERVATAAWIHSRESIRDRHGVGERLHRLKPHIPLEEAIAAYDNVSPLLSGFGHPDGNVVRRQ